MFYHKHLKTRPLLATFFASFAGAFSALFIYTPFGLLNTIPNSESHHAQITIPQNNIRPVHIPSAKFCDTTATCIFDVGFNTGQDTHFYLQNPENRVLAVEANPLLVDAASAKEPFKSAIASGRLKILSVGISEKPNSGNLTFWINQYHEFSSFIEELGCRQVGHGKRPKGDHTFCTQIHVPTVTCHQLLEQHGSPKYMKIDIEGLQKACLNDLAHVNFNDRPTFVSTEGAGPNDVRRYQDLGYRSFKVVNQKDSGKRNLLHGSSGPWGDSAEDVFAGRRWHDVDEIMERLPLNETILQQGWFDLHAKKASI